MENTSNLVLVPRDEYYDMAELATKANILYGIVREAVAENDHYICTETLRQIFGIPPMKKKEGS